MTNSPLLRLLAHASFWLPMGAFALEPPLILPPDDPGADPAHRIVWSTEPGVRYELQRSTDLTDWTTVAGFPTEAAALAQQHKFEASGDRLFFRVVELDEQPPVIVSRRPGTDAFAVKRYNSPIRVELEDASPVDQDSITLSVGAHGPFTLADPELSFENDTLVFDLGGDLALGDWGEALTASLTVADILGNAATYDWSFDLEVEAQIVENIFVFGSPDAVRAGQQIGAIPTRILSTRAAGGPVRMSATADPWTLESVEPNRLLIRYLGDAPPPILAGTYLANLTPVSLDEMFYRMVLSVEDDPGDKLFTIMTVDVALEEIVQEGSTMSDFSDLFFTIGEGGVIEEPDTESFRRLGYSLDGWSGKLTDGSLDLLEIHAEELHWWLTPTFETSLDIGLTGLRRFEGRIAGEVDAAMILDVDVLLAGISYEVPLFRIPAASRPGFWVPLGSIGPIPVSAQVQFNFEFLGEAEAGASMNFRSGFRQEASAEFGIDYDRGREPRIEWIPKDRNVLRFSPTEIEPFTTQIEGELSLKLKLKPSLSFLVYGLAGIEASLPAAGGIVISKSFNDVLTGRLETDVSVEFASAGQALEFLDPKPTLSRTIWERPWHLFPDSESLTLVRQPQSVTIQEGDDLILFAQATAALPVRYQWYQNGHFLWGKDLSSLWVRKANFGAAGEYFVRVTSGGDSVQSETVTVTVTPPPGDPGPVPEGFALVPAGTYARGDHKNEPESWFDRSRPVHNVYVSDFYIARTQVTYEQWRDVYDWAVANGYNFDNPGARGWDYDSSSELSNTPENNQHPVVRIYWYDMVKWCNARSEMEGLIPVYHTNDARTLCYRTGRHEVTNFQVRWEANGYRLPTETEWEKAARGGLHGKRWPWGDEPIDGSRENYWNSSGTNGTTPVGSFPPNGYGLYDMAGNVWEGCWDWWDADWYSKSGATEPDTRGPDSGSSRVYRGGSFARDPKYCRVASRIGSTPGNWSIDGGFRLARTK